MFLHIQTYRFELNEFYLHRIIEISSLIFKADIIIRPVITRYGFRRGCGSPKKPGGVSIKAPQLVARLPWVALIRK